MKLPHRRQLLHLAAGAAALPAVSRNAWAQAYPSRPITIVVGFAAGAATDKFSCQFIQSIKSWRSSAILYGHVLAFDIAGFF